MSSDDSDVYAQAVLDAASEALGRLAASYELGQAAKAELAHLLPPGLALRRAEVALDVAATKHTGFFDWAHLARVKDSTLEFQRQVITEAAGLALIPKI
jgi:hypothetical protein